MDFEALPQFRERVARSECEVLIHDGPIALRDWMILCAIALLLLAIQIALLALEGIPAVLIRLPGKAGDA